MREPAEVPLVEVADVRPPEGHAARSALLVCAEYADAPLLRHSVRSYFFGAAWAGAHSLDFDRELLFVSCMLHDLALTAPFDSHSLPFEEAGGHLARVFTASLGWSRARRDRTAELIVLHMREDVDPARDIESRLLQIGTSADVSGTSLAEFDVSFREALIAAYPRTGFPAWFVEAFRYQAARKPACAAAALVAGDWPARVLTNPLGHH